MVQKILDWHEKKNDTGKFANIIFQRFKNFQKFKENYLKFGLFTQKCGIFKIFKY